MSRKLRKLSKVMRCAWRGGCRWRAKVTHKWAFKPGMRAGAYSWKSSAKAIERLKSASSEIRAVARTDLTVAAEGIIALAQRIWPAFEHIDTSSGALGNAVRRTLEDERSGVGVAADAVTLYRADGRAREPQGSARGGAGCNPIVMSCFASVTSATSGIGASSAIMPAALLSLAISASSLGCSDGRYARLWSMTST